MICEPHLERTGQRIPATREVAGTPMCEQCFTLDEDDPRTPGTGGITDEMRAKALAAWSDPAKRTKMLRNLRHGWKPETREKMSRTMSARYNNPERRAMLGAEMRRRWRDPVLRARMIQGRNGKKS